MGTECQPVSEAAIRKVRLSASLSFDVFHVLSHGVVVRGEYVDIAVVLVVEKRESYRCYSPLIDRSGRDTKSN